MTEGPRLSGGLFLFVGGDALFHRVRPGDEEYRHTTAFDQSTGRGGMMHFKWDKPGKGTHEAKCWSCNGRTVTWQPSGKIKR